MKEMTLDEIIASDPVKPKAAAQSVPQKEVDEVDVLFPTSVEFVVNGENVVIHEFKFGELPKVIKLLKVAGPLFIQASNEDKLSDPLTILSIIEHGGEDLIQLLSGNVGKPREWFDTVGAEDGLAMITALMVINFAFFTNRVPAMLGETLTKLNQ